MSHCPSHTSQYLLGYVSGWSRNATWEWPASNTEEPSTNAGSVLTKQQKACMREYLSGGMVALRVELRVKKCKKYRYRRNVPPHLSLSYQHSSFFPVSSRPFLSQFSFSLQDISICLFISDFSSSFFHSLLSLSLDNSNLYFPLEVLQFPYIGTVSLSLSYSFQSVSFQLLPYSSVTFV